MTQILLRTEITKDTNLKKIGASFYYDQNTKTIYRLSFLPQALVFQNQDVMRPQILSLTKVDPYFLAINYLEKKIKTNDIPEHLKQIQWNRIADKQQRFGDDFYILNQVKVFDFLEDKVKKVIKCIQNNDMERSAIKTEGIQRHYITPQVINILKTQIHNKVLIDTFAKERYSYTPLRRVMVDEPEEHHQDNFAKPFKSKPKSQPKKEEPKLKPNQKTLNSFFKPKEKAG